METLPNLKSRWHARRAAHAQTSQTVSIGTKTAGTPIKDAGLALLDVLLGMAIFALIVVIAIQSVGQFRQRAFETAATSDAQQLSIGIEGYFTDNQTYPALSGGTAFTAANTAAAAGNFPDTDGAAGSVASATVQSPIGVNLTKNTSITNYAYNNLTGTFSYCIVHKVGGTIDSWAIYDSAKGAILDSGRGTPVAVAGVTGGYAAGGITTPAAGLTCGS